MRRYVERRHKPVRGNERGKWDLEMEDREVRG